MSYPNIPLAGPDWQRKATQAVNSLLNQIDYLHISIDGSPTAGQSLFRTKFPVSKTMLQSHTLAYSDVAATGSATANILIGGANAGTIVWAAGATQAVVTLTTTIIPARTEFEVVAPSPADATLSNPTISIALEA